VRSSWLCYFGNEAVGSGSAVGGGVADDEVFLGVALSSTDNLKN
jgi:hypothetical protein